MYTDQPEPLKIVHTDPTITNLVELIKVFITKKGNHLHEVKNSNELSNTELWINSVEKELRSLGPMFSVRKRKDKQEALLSLLNHQEKLLNIKAYQLNNLLNAIGVTKVLFLKRWSTLQLWSAVHLTKWKTFFFNEFDHYKLEKKIRARTLSTLHENK